MTREYEERLGDLAQSKDQQREALRGEMQTQIDDLLRQLEQEKLNMGAAGKKREEELLSQIEALRREIADRDGTISDL